MVSENNHEQFTNPEKMVLCWSGGKESMLSLEKTKEDPLLDIYRLLTIVTGDSARVLMHFVRRELIECQADRLRFPIEIIPIAVSLETYGKIMYEKHLNFKNQGVNRIVFGDIWLGHRQIYYRDQNLKSVDMKGFYPLSGDKSHVHAREIIKRGYRAIIVSVDERLLSSSFCGREYDEKLLSDLPAHVDPCGECGEFHTFVYDAPSFSAPIKVKKGEIKGSFGIWECDLQLME